MYRRRQTFWYILGGLLLLVSGVVALFGVTLPYALPLMLAVAGGIIIAAGLLGFRPAFPAFMVFLLGIVVLGLAASGPYGFSPYTTTETYELSTAQVVVDEMIVRSEVSTGTIKVSFTSNETLIYRIVFTKYYSVFYQPTVDFNYTVADRKLTVNASSTTASVDITLNQNIKSSFNLTTMTGSIRVDVPTTASKVERMTLLATTGEVELNISNTASLRSIIATTTTGQVEASIKSSLQNRDATVQLTTTMGRVKLNLNISNIESDIEASTTTGRINADDVIGFTILNRTQTSFHAQTPFYGRLPSKKLDISANTQTGNIDISAYHR